MMTEIKRTPPRMYVKPEEPYAQAKARWRKRLVEFKDYDVMCQCNETTDLAAGKRRFFKAFYGVPAVLAAEVFS